MAKKRSKRRTAHGRALAAIEDEGRKQCRLMYGAAAIALKRHWKKGPDAITRLFDVSGEAWMECAADVGKSMIRMCEEETGIEVQNGSGQSWEDIAFLNGQSAQMLFTPAQLVYMRQRQAKWVAPQVVACILLALHRKWGFGPERCARFYAQVREIENEFRMDWKKTVEAAKMEAGVDIEDVFMKSRESLAHDGK